MDMEQKMETVQVMLVVNHGLQIYCMIKREYRKKENPLFTRKINLH